MGDVKTTFRADDKEMQAANKRQRAAVAETTLAQKEATKEASRYEAAAVRALNNAKTAAEKLAFTQEGLNRRVKRGVTTQEEANRALEAYRQRLMGNTNAQQGFAQKLQQTAMAYFGISQAIGSINKAYEVWIQNERERQGAARSGVDAVRDFDLVQLYQKENIQQARQRVRDIAVATGAAPEEGSFAALFDAAQSLQSAAGDQKGGLKDLAAVLKAELAGIPVDLGQELIIQARAQGVGDDPAWFIRLAMAMGQGGGRTPRQVAENARVLGFFPDKELGFAVATVLTDVKKEESKTFVKAFANAFNKNPELQRNLGVPLDAPILEVMKSLSEFAAKSGLQGRALGFELQQRFGIEDIRAFDAMQIILENEERVQQLRMEQGARARDPELIDKLIAERLQTTPESLELLRLRQAETAFQFERAFEADPLRRQRRLTERGLESERRGERQILFFDVADERGQERFFIPALRRAVRGTPGLFLLDQFLKTLPEFAAPAGESVNEPVGETLQQLRNINSNLETLRPNNRVRPVPAEVQ